MKIKYSKRETRNLGNYENVTIEISIEDNVDSLTESKEECFLRLRNFVNDRLSAQLTETKTVKKAVDIEDVKNKVLSLIDKNENNRESIKNILKTYKATRIQHLNNSELENFIVEIENL